MPEGPLPVHLTPEQQRVKEAMARRARTSRTLGRIRHTLVVLSGKGGVGKTTVAVNLAVSLAQRGWQTGLLDVDLTGPDAPLMVGLQGKRFPGGPGLIRPMPVEGLPLVVASMAFVLGDDTPVVWRGPLKTHALGQLLGDVDWGDLDFLVLDLPPGTGDEALAVAEAVPDADGAVVVTTPQDVAALDVRKALHFARLVKLPVLGLVENMSGFTCPNCAHEYDVFGHGAGQRLSQELDVPLLGRVPLEVELVARGDAGTPFVRSLPQGAAARAFEAIVDRLLAAVDEPARAPTPPAG